MNAGIQMKELGVMLIVSVVLLVLTNTTQRFIAQRYHTTEANLHNWLKKNGIKCPKPKRHR
jgi:hypothetical protein